MAHAAAERQTGDAGAGNDARRNGEAEGVSGVVDCGPGAAGADEDRLCGRIDADVVDAGEVDHQAIVTDAEAGGVVSAAADRDFQAGSLAELHCGHYVRYAGAVGDHERLAVDHGVVDFAGLVVTCVVWLDYGAAKPATKIRDALRRCHLCSPDL